MAGDLPAEVVDIGSGIKIGVVGADAALQVVDVVSVDGNNITTSNGTAVHEIAGQVKVDTVTGQQATCAVNIPFFKFNVYLRHQGLYFIVCWLA